MNHYAILGLLGWVAIVWFFWHCHKEAKHEKKMEELKKFYEERAKGRLPPASPSPSSSPLHTPQESPLPPDPR